MTQRPLKRRAGEAHKTEDVVLLCGKTDDGKGVNVLRKRGNTVQAGVVRPIEHGKPLTGEVVQLEPRGTTPLCDVTVCYSPEVPTPPLLPEAPRLESESRGHPARVASDDYRRNWDAIWKRSGGKSWVN